jgi:diamine N-acetyltransferase
MILGKRTRLRAIERDDLPRFVAWMNDPEVIRGLLMAGPLSMAQEERWFANLQNRPVEEHPLGIDVSTPEGWIHIGNIALHSIMWRDSNAEVGIMIGEKRFWSQGYGRDAMVLMLRHAFYTLGLNRVYLRVFATNPRAVHSYEKAGFVHEGTMRQAHLQDGAYVDELLMGALRSEWRDQEDV